MTVTLPPEVEAAVAAKSKQWGLPPEQVVAEVVARYLLPGPFVPRGEWERLVASAASDCGASLTNEQLSREVMYD